MRIDRCADMKGIREAFPRGDGNVVGMLRDRGVNDSSYCQEGISRIQPLETRSDGLRVQGWAFAPGASTLSV